MMIMFVSVCGTMDRDGCASFMSPRLSRAQVDEMQRRVKERLGWNPDDYELEFMAEWDNSRVPLVAGIPTKMKIDFSPIFAILPDGILLSVEQPKAFERIVTGLVTPVKATDAMMLAQLSVWFGRFNDVIGESWPRSVDGKIPKKQIQRSETEPVLRVNREGFELRFYAYDYELLRLSDCTVRMKSGTATFTCIKYQRQQ